MELGADVNAVNLNNQTALHSCAPYSNNLQLLLQYGVDVNIININGDTALNSFWRCTAFHDSAAIREYKQILLNHLLKLYDLGKYICRENLEFLTDVDIFDQNFVLELENEIELMKEISLNYYTTLYDFVFMNENMVTRYVYNDRLTEILKNNNYDFEN